MQLQELWLQTGMVFFVAAASAVALYVARRRVAAPLVVFGTLFLVGRAVGFLLAYFVSDSPATSPLVQVLTHYARILPSVLLLIYACAVLARRYRVARSRDLSRVWLRRAPYVHGGAVLLNLMGDLVLRPSLLEGSRGVPAASFWVSVPNYVTAVAYAVVCCVVFLGAARSGEGADLGIGQRVQNFSWGVALGGLGLLTSLALVRNGIRAFASEERVGDLVEALSSYEWPFFVVYAGGIAVGIFAYYAQSRRNRFVERFFSFLDLVGDLSEEMANAPLSRTNLSIPHSTLREAAGEEFLGLSLEDLRKADAAFRLKVVWEHRAGAADGRISRGRMADLLEAYEYELKEPVIARGLRTEPGGKTGLPEFLRDLLPGEDDREGLLGSKSSRGLSDALALVLRDEEELAGTDLVSLPEWEQLAYVALADAELLLAEKRAAVLRGNGISGRVLKNYRLAGYKLHTYRQGGRSSTQRGASTDS